MIKSSQHERAVSLLETVVALALFSITVTVFIAALSVGFGVTTLTVNEVTSASLATSQLENTLAQAYSEPPDYPGVPTTGGFSISFNNFVIDPTVLTRITTSVFQGQSELLELTTHKVNEAFIASPPSVLFSQRDFRWFENTGDLTPNFPRAIESTPIIPSELGPDDLPPIVVPQVMRHW